MGEPPSTADGEGQKPLDEQAYNQHSAASLGQQQQYGASSQNLGSANEGCYLWIGELQPWMDEGYLKSIFRETAKVVSAKVIRNMQTGQSEGYGFVEFISHVVAESVLQKHNGAPMPGCEQTFRLNWAQALYYIYVGNLAPEVTDDMLMDTFKNVYTSVQGAYVVVDRITGRKTDYGFVRFGDEKEKMRAMSEMNGQQCSNRPMRIAPPKKRLTMQPATYQNTQGGNLGEGDTNNRTVGGESIRLSWGRYKQHDQAQWNGARYHGYPPQPRGYNAPYGYAPHPPPPPPQPHGYPSHPYPPPPQPPHGYAPRPHPPPPQPHAYNEPFGYASNPPPPPPLPHAYNEPYGYVPRPHPPPPLPHAYNEPFGYASNPPPPPPPLPHAYNEPFGYASNPPPPPPLPHGYNRPFGYASNPPPQNPNPYYGGYTGYVNYQQQQQVNDMPQQVLVRKRKESEETSVISKKRRLR